MRPGFRLILQALGVMTLVPAIVLVTTVAPRWVLGASVACCAPETDGVVESKRESVAFHHENWRHSTEVTVRYRPRGTQATETVTQNVDPALFDALQIGEPVRVRYTGIDALRRYANGAGLAGTSLASREVLDHGLWGELLDNVFMMGSFMVFILSFFLESTRMRWAGVVAVAASAAGQMMMGWLVFPALFLLARKRRGAGFGRALLVAIPLSVAVMALRMPWPDALPSGPTGEATATVRQVATIDRLWGARAGHLRVGVGNASRGFGSTSTANNGTTIDAPFLLVDMEFTPPGSQMPVHAVDRVDQASVPALAPGAQVRVRVPQANPRAAQLVDARRHYALDALGYLLLWTGGMCLIGLPLVWPLVAFGLWLARTFGFIPSAATASAAPAQAAGAAAPNASP